MADPTSRQRTTVMRGKPPTIPEDAPLYRVTRAPHFLNGRVVFPGEQVRFAGIPGIHLEPVDESAHRARAAADAGRAARKAQAEFKSGPMFISVMRALLQGGGGERS